MKKVALITFLTVICSGLFAMETDALIPKTVERNKLSINNESGEVISIAYSPTQEVNFKLLMPKQLERGERFNLPENAGFLVVPTKAGVFALIKACIPPQRGIIFKDRFVLGTLKPGQSRFGLDVRKCLSQSFVHASLTIAADGVVTVEEK